MEFKNGRLNCALVVRFENCDAGLLKMFFTRLGDSWCPALAKSAEKRQCDNSPYIQLYIERNCSIGYDDHPVPPSRYYSDGNWMYASPDEVLDYFSSYNSN